MYVVTDVNGNLYGPFGKARDAAAWAEKKWPGQSEDTGEFGVGWSVTLIFSPETRGL